MTVEQYLAGLPADRAERAGTLREVAQAVDAALAEGFVCDIQFGMIVWSVPLSTYPNTYNGKPLMYAALAAQKNHNALYLNCLPEHSAADAAFRASWAATGRRLDMGKSCLRFRTLDDLDLGLVAGAVGGTTVAEFVADYEASRAGGRRGG
jgi:hypothetical protein